MTPLKSIVFLSLGMLIPSTQALAEALPSPLETAKAYQTAFATLQFETLKTLMTKRAFAHEFRDEEREFLRAQETKAPADVAEWEEELREAKHDASEMSLLSEQIQGDRAIVSFREDDDYERSYILLSRENAESPWLIVDPDEDDQKDVERFLKSPLSPTQPAAPTAQP